MMSSPIDPSSNEAESLECTMDAAKFDQGVQDAIEDYKAKDLDAFESPTRMVRNDYGILLHTLLRLFHKNCLMDYATCSDYVVKRLPLYQSLYDAYSNRKFAHLMSHSEMPSANQAGSHIDHELSPIESQKSSMDAVRFDQQVLNAIKEYKAAHAGTFVFSDRLVLDDHPILLHINILLETFHKKCRMDHPACISYSLKHLPLFGCLDRVYLDQTFADLMTDSEMPSSNEVCSHCPHTVFKGSYHSDTATLLIETLNEERKGYFKKKITKDQSLFNWSIAVIQSSGMGKSRMVDEAANTVFTLPINLCEDSSNGEIKYPPPDAAVRQFFAKYKDKSDEEQRVAYAIFLRALFTRARERVEQDFAKLTGSKLVRAWADYFREGQSQLGVGQNRRSFYEGVIQAAESIAKENTQTLHYLVQSLRECCKQLTDLVQPKPDQRNACFVYFDDAHSLTEDVARTNNRAKFTAYENLGIVLSSLVKYPVFFIFLSTSSRIQTRSPSPYQCSTWELPGSRSVAPYIELPFDIYEYKVAEDSDLWTLRNMCKTEMMVNFGRPLWYNQYMIDPNADIFKFAMDKLCAGRNEDSLLAALGVRVGITFDSDNSCAVE
ncbi:unnamed protein product [Rhizoctonia solani]|uniref:Uncharacterized protein n=1 Tax=Rhizoctonia solani TaxID=456999 RepID=A0A8H3H1Q7_9AGAM|nr:unnamed protein product [Rhizoctonia solani]